MYLLTTPEELAESPTKIPKVKFIASCGHENEVFVNVFISRNTGVKCKVCLAKQYKENKPTKNTSNQEYRGYLLLKDYLKDEFDIVKMNEGCLADCAIRRKGIEDDDWIGIQLKTTESDKFNMYKFTIPKKYPDCFVVCIQIPKELFWILDGNEENGLVHITYKRDEQLL
jgi:hypothetical protein